MSYVLTTLWHDRQRYLPGVLATAFSALLMAVQCGLLLGMFSFASAPVDHTNADVWVGGRDIPTVDRGYPIPTSYLTRLAAQPEVERCEVFIEGFAPWYKSDGSSAPVMIIGSRLEDDALGAIRELTPDLRARLAEPGAVVVDESSRGHLGIRGVGDRAEVAGRRVRVVGMVAGVRDLFGAYVFCSLPTAQSLLSLSADQATYVLGRCANPDDAPAVVARLNAYPTLSAFTGAELSKRSQMHWLRNTRAGFALGYAAVLGVLVGAVVTSQTLYAATAASLREYTMLWALGIPRRRVVAVVLGQSLWVGASGVVLALPVMFLLAGAADGWGLRVVLPPWLVTSTAVVTMSAAMLSGLVALGSLRHMELSLLLRH